MFCALIFQLLFQPYYLLIVVTAKSESSIRNKKYAVTLSCFLPVSKAVTTLLACTQIILQFNGETKSHFFLFFFFFNLTHNRWTSLPSCLWSQRIFPSLPVSRLIIFYRDASSALLQLVNLWLNFTYSLSHAFRYERKNTNPTLVRIEPTSFALAGVQVTY